MLRKTVAFTLLLFVCVAWVFFWVSVGMYIKVYINSEAQKNNSYTKPYAFNDSLDVSISSDLLVAEGNCVEKAIAITYILFRDNKLDGNVYAAVCDNHVQMVRIDNGEWVFYDVLFWNVVKSEDEFDDGKIIELYDPFVFVSAALTFYPNITKEDLDKFVAKLSTGD